MIPVRAGQAGGEILCAGCGNCLVQYRNSGHYRGFHCSKNLTLVLTQRGIDRRALFFLDLLDFSYLWQQGSGFVYQHNHLWKPQPFVSRVTEKTNAEIYDAWKNHFSKATVERPQWGVEKQYAQQTYLKQGASWVLLFLSGVGAVCATYRNFRTRPFIPMNDRSPA